MAKSRQLSVLLLLDIFDTRHSHVRILYIERLVGSVNWLDKSVYGMVNNFCKEKFSNFDIFESSTF